MKPADIAFHDKILRAVKGLIKAYEEWITARRAELN